tara:strand:- start:91 stop:1341 length:1251 start_codon:yes stop_codon:yes gene_type:complete
LDIRPAVPEGLEFRHKIGGTGEEFKFLATNIRKEKTGVHAQIRMGVGSTLAASSVFNVERDGDRRQLARAAHKAIGEVFGRAYALDDLQRDLMLFCLNLWPLTLKYTEGEMLTPVDTRVTELIKGMVIDGGGTLLFAPPGRGKSYTAMLMAVSVDAGCRFLFNVEQGKVLFVNLERGGVSIQRRLYRVNQALGLPSDRPLLTLNARGKSLVDIAESVKSTVREHGVELVVVDSISRAGAGDLSGNREANQIIDILNGIARTWLGIAHSPRADAGRVYGSVHFDAGADVVINVISERKQNVLGVGLKVVKANDLPTGSLWGFAYEFTNEEGLVSARQADVSEFPEIAAVKMIGPVETLIEYHKMVNIKSTIAQAVLATELPKSAIEATYKADPRFVPVPGWNPPMWRLQEEQKTWRG